MRCARAPWIAMNIQNTTDADHRHQDKVTDRSAAHVTFPSCVDISGPTARTRLPPRINAGGGASAADHSLAVSLLSRLAHRAGLVIVRQTFVRRSHTGTFMLALAVGAPQTTQPRP